MMMKKITRSGMGWVSAVFLLSAVLTIRAAGAGTDPAHRYAWGGNVGWVNAAATNAGQEVEVHFDGHTGWLSGFAWGENIGWLKFRGSSPDYGVRTLAFDQQPHGSPNWWLDRYGVTEDYDAGDGVPAWKKFVMDTDPRVDGSVLQIEQLDHHAAESGVRFHPSSSNRYYTLLRRDDLFTGSWSNVPGQTVVPGTSGVQVLTDDDAAVQQAYYRIRVSVSP